MEPITFNFIPTKDDYFRVTRIVPLHSRRLRIGLALFPVLACIALGLTLLSFAHSARTGHSNEFATSAVIILLILTLFYGVILLSFLVLIPAIAGRHFEKTERLHTVVSIEVDDTHLIVRSGDITETKQSWELFREAAEVKDYYFLQNI